MPVWPVRLCNDNNSFTYKWNNLTENHSALIDTTVDKQNVDQRLIQEEFEGVKEVIKNRKSTDRQYYDKYITKWEVDTGLYNLAWWKLKTTRSHENN